MSLRESAVGRITMEKDVNSNRVSGESYPFSIERLREWIIAFVVCDFNVDIGPEIEMVYPKTRFSQSDLSSICFNSFPERQDSEVTEDLSFHFIIRNQSPEINPKPIYSQYGKRDFFYASCVFRQEPDSLAKRRFGQKSLVLISQHDFPSLCLKLASIMTATEAISNPSMLEAACTQIADWEPPRAGLHKLSFLRHPLPLEVAVHSAFPLQGISVTSTIPPQLVSAFQPSGSWDALIHLLPSLSELYLLFEQVLLCEPIVVLAKNPQLCSEFVSAIVDLVRPVPFAGDVRPYITMQSEFFNNNIGGRATRHYLIGITNPFLLKRISALSEDIGSSTPHIVYLQGSSAAVPIRLHHHRHQIHVDYQVPGAMSPPNRARGHISKDQTFLKNIDTMLRSNGSDAAEVSSVIRRHFAYITGAFLAPINRYLATLMSSSAITSPGGNLQYSHFSEVDFLQSLSKHGTSIQFKGQTSIHRHKAEAAFYSKFCRSSNFYSWLEMKLGLEKEAFAGAVGQGTIQGQKTEWPWLPGGCIE